MTPEELRDSFPNAMRLIEFLADVVSMEGRGMMLTVLETTLVAIRRGDSVDVAIWHAMDEWDL